MIRPFTLWGVGPLLMALLCGVAHGEQSCAPSGSWPPKSSFLTDKFYEQARSKWATVVSSRYLEGKDACKELLGVKGYESFPVIECSYSSNGRSSPGWPALRARVRLLEPSAAQLALWTVHACRVNGKTTATMGACIDKVVSHIKGQNGAQFPVAGTVVEQHCDSSPKVKCGPNARATAIERKPRNAPFRDGVAVETRTQSEWSFESLDDKTFDLLFAESDDAVTWVFDVARVAGVYRDDWLAWRQARGLKAILPDRKRWHLISREAHKAACRSDSNELVDALVYRMKTTGN
jgi:hypothetical protein